MHVDFCRLHYARAVFFAVRCVAPAVEQHAHIAEPDRYFRHIHISHARVADGHDQPPEIRIGGEKRGFDQRRMRDALSDARGLIVIRRAADADGDEFGGAFAVARYGLRKRRCHGQHRRAQRGVVGAGRTGERHDGALHGL